MRICVAGGGAYGTAIAIALARARPVTLWMRDADTARQMAASRRSTLLDVDLPETLEVTADPDALEADAVLLAVPAQKMRGFLAEHRGRLAGRVLVSCAKGIDTETLQGPSALIREMLPDARPAVISGPSFAADIAKGLPTALAFAIDEGGEDLQAALSTPAFRLYLSHDIAGVELGGALKNIMAIACGATIGAGYGDSARAALMTRGFAEMTRFAVSRGARAETLAGLSGLGDLALTCTSELSRNYRAGLAIGRGAAWDTGDTIEGAATARSVARIAEAEGLDMPISTRVDAVARGEMTLEAALGTLLDRPLKSE